MRALVTGATGFVGRHLLRGLESPVILTRNRRRADQTLNEFGVSTWSWEPQREPPVAEAFEGVDTVFHLAGEPLGEGRWNASKKAQLRDSRVVGTRNLVETLGRLDRKPSVLVAASAVGYYGDRGDEFLDEASGPGQDFLSDVCVAWEQESRRAAEFGIRVVIARLGIVLGPNGGALTKLLPPFRLGLGSALGSGQQWLPWIHIADVVGLLINAARTAALSGPLNITAPHPVRNCEFGKILAGVLRRPAFMPAVPAFVLRLALGEFADALLASQCVIPKVAQALDYPFKFPELQPALFAILNTG